MFFDSDVFLLQKKNVSIEFNNPNQLKRLMCEEGIKNPADIWDIETYEEIIEDVEKATPNIIELLDKEVMTHETLACLDTTRSFCKESSEKFREAFLTLIESYRKENRNLSQKILDHLIEKRFDLPNFTIANAEHAIQILEDCQMDDYLADPKSILLVFNLPKPLGHFWWKGGVDSWGHEGKNVSGSVIEWGHFYRELTPVIWKMQGLYENEYALDFERINSVSVHDPKKYYYLWQITKWK